MRIEGGRPFSPHFYEQEVPMLKVNRVGRVASNSLCLAAGILIGSAGLLSPAAFQSPKSAAVNPQERGIDANLYMQTSAEYAAVCLQTYNWSLERLKQKLAATKNADLRPAIV